MSGGRLSYLLRLAPFVLFFLACLAICPGIGSVDIDLLRALRGFGSEANNLDAAILFTTRLPRTLLAALTGSALALAGATFQALLRNPLATPFTLGVSSGGALGAVIAIKIGLDFSLFGFSSVPLFSFAASLGTVALVYLLARSRVGLPTSILLLAGVTISFFFSALILFVHYIADFTESHQMLRWLMGGLDIVGYRPLLGLLPLWTAGVVLLLLESRNLDQISLGSYLASSRGVDTTRTKRRAYLAASLLTGGVVSLAGPIGFVGLIVPHTLRLLIGPGYRLLVPASVFAGAGFLVLCDTIARTILAPMEIPVGVLTAVIGGPFFLALLLREKKRYGWED